jgi:hypothetical protein
VTLRLTLGCDPGQTGCIALLADGEPAGFIDMPTMPRAAGGREIVASVLASRLREALRAHPGAAVLAVCEQVSSMPKQGLASTFRFGQSDGILRGVLGALGIGFMQVPAQTWKRHFRLTGQPKDAARALAIRRFPSAADQLARKKDGGRGDALLIALWAETTEQAARLAA